MKNKKMKEKARNFLDRRTEDIQEKRFRQELFEVSTYVRFVIYAVLGKMAEADDFYDQNKAVIHKVATAIRERTKLVVPSLLYRGLLLKRKPQTPFLPPDPRGFMPWISTTENKGVACYFANPSSSMAPPDYMGFDLGKEGVIALIPGDARRVLWCHHYRHIPLSNGMTLDLFEYAKNTLSPEYFHQFTHNALTQQEYILTNSNERLRYEFLDSCPPLDELETLFGYAQEIPYEVE